MNTDRLERLAPLTGIAAPTAPIRATTAGAAVVASLLLLASSIAWAADEAGVRAITQMWAFVAFAVTSYGFAERLRPTAPRTAAVQLVLGAIGACAGAAFALEIAMVDHFGIERFAEQEGAAPVLLLLLLPGIVFPVSLIHAAVALWRSRLGNRAIAGLLAAGAVLFPASRIPEVPGLAVAADTLLCVALAVHARHLMSTATAER